MKELLEKCHRCGAARGAHEATSGFCPTQFSTHWSTYTFLSAADAIQHNDIFREEKATLAGLLGKARVDQRAAERQRDELLEAIDQYIGTSSFNSGRIASDKIEEIRAEIEAAKPK